MDKQINLNGYGPLPFMDTNPSNFINKTTILYGVTGTGKSTLCRYILSIIRPHVPNIIVICPTAAENKDYDDIAPHMCIFTTIQPNTLSDIYERQKAATSAYNISNDINILTRLFEKCRDIEKTEDIEKIQKISSQKLRKVASSTSLDYSQKKEQSSAITNKTNSSIIKIYKACIDEYRDKLLKMNLTEDEKKCIKFLYINPRIVVVLDDVQAQFSELDPETLAKFLMQFRHVNGTLLGLFQTDNKSLSTELRQNAFNSIFTDANVCIHFFENKSNSFTKEMKKKAAKIIEELFKPRPDGIKTYKYFVYSRLDPVHKFRYVIADIVTNIKFGSPWLWKMDELMPQTDQKIERTKFTERFGI